MHKIRNAIEKDSLEIQADAKASDASSRLRLASGSHTNQPRYQRLGCQCVITTSKADIPKCQISTTSSWLLDIRFCVSTICSPRGPSIPHIRSTQRDTTRSPAPATLDELWCSFCPEDQYGLRSIEIVPLVVRSDVTMARVLLTTFGIKYEQCRPYRAFKQ